MPETILVLNRGISFQQETSTLIQHSLTAIMHLHHCDKDEERDFILHKRQIIPVHNGKSSSNTGAYKCSRSE